MSVEDFKKGMGVPEIEVKKNPHTGKCFFVYGLTGMLGRHRGAVLYAPPEG